MVVRPIACSPDPPQSMSHANQASTTRPAVSNRRVALTMIATAGSAYPAAGLPAAELGQRLGRMIADGGHISRDHGVRTAAELSVSVVTGYVIAKVV